MHSVYRQWDYDYVLCLDSNSEECILNLPRPRRRVRLCLDSNSEECILVRAAGRAYLLLCLDSNSEECILTLF